LTNLDELKPALTIDQQLNLLEERGIIIDDKSEAELFLIDNNYYRLNIYFHKTMVSQKITQPFFCKFETKVSIVL